MKLHLVRHGKAEKVSNTGHDFDRSLAAKGVAQSEILGAYLKSKGISEDSTVLCSDAMRTRNTLSGLRVSIPFQNVKYTTDLYLCSQAELLKMIWQQSENNDLIIIGHNFGISDLATYFTEEHVELRTAEYICLHFESDSWIETSRGLGQIIDRYRPSVDL